MGKTGRIEWGRGAVLFYVLFLIIPVILWIAGEGGQIFFDNWRSSIMTIAKFSGIVGLCFFAGNLMLSGRYAFMDRLFGGLDKVYLFHRRTGLYVFALATVHVLGMTWPFFRSFESAFGFLFDYSDMPTLFGKGAYVLLLSLIILTIYCAKNFKYEKLKWLHSWMGAAFLLGGVHGYLVPSDIAYNMPMRVYVLSVAAIGAISYLARTVFKKLFVRRKILDVQHVNTHMGNVTEVVMKPRAGAIDFTPGQFVFVRFKQEGFPYEDHPFSITASPEEGLLRISAKALGDFTGRLDTLKPGAVAEIQGPFGGFTYGRTSNTKQVWVAGGIGITPFLAMARSIRDGNITNYDIDLYYSVQTEGDLVFIDELREIGAKMANFKLHPWIAAHDGYLTADAMRKGTDLPARDVFLCGPPPMMSALVRQLAAMGVSGSQIHFEKFQLLK